MPAASETDPALHDSAFLRAARSEPTPHTPVWFMRQAGRSLPEYLKVREGISMLESCMRPELVVEITMQPVRRYGVDAAIFFSDIVLPLKAVGVDLDIEPGVGPVVAQPVRTMADVEAIPDLTPEHVPYITEAVQGLVGELGATPLIGFAGAPFTVASYLVEGGPSKEHARTKALMFGAPDVWAALMRKISGIAAAYLEVQVDGRRLGGAAVRLVGRRGDARRLPHPRAAVVGARAGADRRDRACRASTSASGTGEILDLMGEAGADVVGVDWRVPLAAGIERAGGRAVQGNLDPTLVFAPDRGDARARRARCSTRARRRRATSSTSATA